MRKKNIEFQKKKQVILFLYDYTCQCCGLIDVSNHVHHIDQNGDNHNAFNLVPLCSDCHKAIHRNLLFAVPDPTPSLRLALQKLNSFF